MSKKSGKRQATRNGFILLFAIVALASACHAARAANAFTPAQESQLKTMFHDYLVQNPQAVIDALKSYQDQADKEDAASFQANITKYKSQLITATTPFAGNPKGTKTVVEFFDYNCGYCKHAVDDVVGLIKADSQAKVYFKDMPILAESSNDAARYALAAGKQGKYYEFHTALMHSAAPRTKELYVKIGRDIGLDTDKLSRDAEGDPAIKTAIENNLTLSRALGIHGTPAFIMRDTLYPGYMGLSNMQKALNTAAAGTAGPSDTPTAN